MAVRWLPRILSCRIGRAVTVAAITIVAWAVWWLMLERPVRELMIPGEFGVCRASVDVDCSAALISAITRPYSASFRDRHSCFVGAYGVEDPGIQANFLLDLRTGHCDCLDMMDWRTRQYAHSSNRDWKTKFDFGETPRERWWMIWKRNDDLWTLRDADSESLIAANRCDSKTFVGKPNYPPNRRWVTISEHRPNGDDDILTRFLRRWINWPAQQTDNLHLLVFDPATGEKVNDVLSWTVCRWTPDGDHFWTVDTIYSAKGEARGVACRMWQAHAQGPPWWLVSMTVLSGGMAVWGQLAARNRRSVYDT